MEIGAATGEFVLIVVARGRVCPVSRNYVAALAELSPDLEALGVETVVVSGSDSRPAAAAFGDAVRAAASDGHDVDVEADVEVSWADDARGVVTLDGTVFARRSGCALGANSANRARRMRSQVRARVVRMFRGAIVKIVCG